MKTPKPAPCVCPFLGRRAPSPVCIRRGEIGLTLFETLVVIAVIGFVAINLLPRFTDNGVYSVRVMCLNNVRQNVLGVSSYAIDNNGLLPSVPAGQNHLPWDVPWAAFEVLQREGLTREKMYDPAFAKQNDDRLWNAKSNEYHTIGYALALSGSNSSVLASNQNLTLTNASIDNATRVLVADVVISLSGQDDPRKVANYQWKNIPGGLPNGTKTPNGRWQGFSTSHFDQHGKLPRGGNIGMLDGHAVWRQFNEMVPRTTGADNSPIFWW